MATEPETTLADEPSLIATFYCERVPAMDTLQERFYRALSGITTGPVPDSWISEDGNTILDRFDPAAAHDTRIVQLALSATGDAATTWSVLRDRLAAAIDDATLAAVWGFTLVYQAELLPDVDANEALPALLPAVHRLRDESPLGAPLATAAVPGGRLWLLEIPLQGDGANAQMIYMALGPKAAEETLVRQTLYGSNARLLMPDLIAHKGYHQMREYRSDDLVSRYEQAVTALDDATDRLLGDLDHGPTAGDLQTLASTYDRLARVVPRLNALRVSLHRQQYNFAVWRTRLGDDPILAFHATYLDTAVHELALLVEQVRDTLGSAGTAVALARARTEKVQEQQQAEAEKAREQRQARVQQWLAVLAVVFALPMLLDRDVVAAFLRVFGAHEPKGGFCLLLLFGIQVAIVALCAVGAWFAVQRRSIPGAAHASGTPSDQQP